MNRLAAPRGVDHHPARRGRQVVEKSLPHALVECAVAALESRELLAAGGGALKRDFRRNIEEYREVRLVLHDDVPVHRAKERLEVAAFPAAELVSEG